MKKILLTFACFLFLFSAHAGERSVLSVLMKDGTNVCFYLSEQPVVRFVGGDVKIVSTAQEATVLRTLVDHFKFLDKMPTDIDNPEVGDNEFTRDNVEIRDNAVSVSGLLAQGVVRLFSIKGQLLASVVADDNGRADLSLESLPVGIYLIHYNEATIKFIKR